MAPVPEGLQPGTPFSVNILALAIYLRFTHAISYQRLSRLFQHLFALQVSEGALDAMFRRAKPYFDNEIMSVNVVEIRVWLRWPRVMRLRWKIG
jgi:transposase